MQRASLPLPAPAPEIGAARKSSPGARGKLGRHTAVRKAVRKPLSSTPGGLLISTIRTAEFQSGIISASAKGNDLNVSRMYRSADRASPSVGFSGTGDATSVPFSRNMQDSGS